MPSIDDVLAGGACSGCGACSVATSGRIPITLTPYGARQASTDGASDADKAIASRVCPFARESPDEDAVAAEVFPPTLDHDDRIGRFLKISAAQVASDDYVIDSSSGGMTSWFVGRLLAEGDVDGVIHVGRDEADLFGYRVSYDMDAVLGNRKSAYYATTFADAVSSIEGDGRRYAIVGVPCFITAARHLVRVRPSLADQLVYFVGLVCGHLKTEAFAQLLAWQVGVAPDQLAEVDFRVKHPHRDAQDYSFAARRRGRSQWASKPNRRLFGANWGHAMFQLGACDFCDDIFAETADVVLGDAWLEGFRQDWRGTNVVITRSPRLQEILDSGEGSGAVRVWPLSPDDAAKSQAGNYRHRRDGLAVRLADDIAEGRWVPLKRVKPDADRVGAKRRSLIRQRRALSRTSHAAFAAAREAGSLRTFMRVMRPKVNAYVLTDLGPMMGRLTIYAPWLARSRFVRNSFVRGILSRARTRSTGA